MCSDIIIIERKNKCIWFYYFLSQGKSFSLTILLPVEFSKISTQSQIEFRPSILNKAPDLQWDVRFFQPRHVYSRIHWVLWIVCEITSVKLESSGFQCTSGVDVFIECFQHLWLPSSAPSLDDKNNVLFEYPLQRSWLCVV